MVKSEDWREEETKNPNLRRKDMNHLHRINEILSYVKPGMKVLDVGSSWFSMEDLLPNNCEYTCIDIEKKKGTIKVNLDKDKIPFDDNHFDIILIGEVLEHLTNFDNALSELSRVGKTMVGSTPNAHSCRGIINHLIGRDTSIIKEHLVIWSKYELRNLLENYFDEVNVYGHTISIKNKALCKGKTRFGDTLIFVCSLENKKCLD